MSGWIKLHRKLTEWEWYSDVNTSRVFLHLLLVANHKDNQWRGIPIKRGQRLSSLSKLAAETNLSIKNIRTAIKRLKATNEVASHSTAQNTMFTVLNYDLYQGGASETAEETASEGQAKGKQGATNKNEKNEKNEKNKDISDSRFDEFYDLYGKKTGGKKAKVKFDSLSKKEIDKIFEVVSDYVLSTPEKQYRKAPLVWLNGECWNDEIQKPLDLKSYDYVLDLFNEAMKDHSEVPQACMMDNDRIENLEYLFANTSLEPDSMVNYFEQCSIGLGFGWYRERNQFDLTWYLSTAAYKIAKEKQ